MWSVTLGIRAGNTVEDVIEWNFSTVKITVLARLDKALGFAQRRGIDENYVLFFRRRVEKVEELWSIVRILSLLLGAEADGRIF